MRHETIPFLFLAAWAPLPVAAQPNAKAQPPAEQLQAANASFLKGEWQTAFDQYIAISNSFPSHALSQFRVGVSLLELGRAAEAQPKLRSGEHLGIPPAQAGYRLAQTMADLKRPDSAMAELSRAIRGGLMLPPSALSNDKHLAQLKTHPRWAGLMDTLDINLRPCMHDPRFREFDFWVGDWDVRPTGQPPSGPPARNLVTIEDNGCVVMEHWNSPIGSEGQSFNIFDRSVGLWRQTWVDNTGEQHDYRGALKNGNMAFMGETPAPNGARGHIPTRLTFFHISKDSVRQFSETSSDSGRTWQTSYDLLYARHPGSPGAREALAGHGTSPTSLTDADRNAILRMDSSFVNGWLRDDTTAVLSVFSPDAVLLPPNAVPVTGLAAIRLYWWPADGTQTRIRRFERTIAEVGGSRDLAFLRGSNVLQWDYTKNDKTTTNTSRSTDLVLMSPDASGRWHVIRQMWSALP